MKLEDIKIGETYNVRVTVALIGDSIIHCSVGKNTANFWKSAVSEFSPISPETYPKYDPCREFREGDKVRVRKIHGKLPQCRYNGMIKVKEGDCCTIHEKEHRNCYWVTIPSGGNWCLDAAYFELVTPVEEMEPYSVDYEMDCWRVCDNDGVVSVYNERHPHAKEAAEAERDRLNAAHRKERE